METVQTSLNIITLYPLLLRLSSSNVELPCAQGFVSE